MSAMIDIERIKEAFTESKKLKNYSPNIEQLNNVQMRLEQIFTSEELSEMESKEFARQVERVWPIAKYVDED